MSNFIPPNKVVNSNDNLRGHWIQIVDDDKKEALVKQISLANYIIEKHVPFWWKNYPSSPEYQSGQMMTCFVLAHAPIYEKYVYEYISMYLQCSPIPLMNDPELKHIQQS